MVAKSAGCHEVIPRLVRGEVRSHSDTGPGAGAKTVETAETQHDAGKCPGHRQLSGVGEAGLSVNQVAMEFGTEGALHLGCSSAEEYASSSAAITVDGQALRFKPGRNFGKVGIAHAKASRVLLRRKPLAIVRRVRVLLFRQQLIDSGLLSGRELEDNGRVTDFHAAFDPALVKLRPGLGMRRREG